MHWERWFHLLGVHLREVALPLQRQRNGWVPFPSSTLQHRHRDTCRGFLTWTLALYCALHQIPCFCGLVQLLFWVKPSSIPVPQDSPPEDGHTTSLKFGVLKFSQPDWKEHKVHCFDPGRQATQTV